MIATRFTPFPLDTSVWRAGSACRIMARFPNAICNVYMRANGERKANVKNGANAMGYARLKTRESYFKVSSRAATPAGGRVYAPGSMVRSCGANLSGS